MKYTQLLVATDDFTKIRSLYLVLGNIKQVMAMVKIVLFINSMLSIIRLENPLLTSKEDYNCLGTG